MNYLAHLHLSNNNERIMVGNFIADWVKGNKFNNYQSEIKQGILLHRAIDSFTDNHPLHKHSRQIFAPSYGRFSGIVVDVLYDHFLSAHWSRFSNISRLYFIQHSYKVMWHYKCFLPARPQRLLPSIVHHDWIGCYVSFYGLQKVLERMSRRTALPAFSNDAILQLRLHYSSLEDDFLAFYPELIAFVNATSLGNF